MSSPSTQHLIVMALFCVDGRFENCVKHKQTAFLMVTLTIFYLGLINISYIEKSLEINIYILLKYVTSHIKEIVIASKLYKNISPLWIWQRRCI